MVKFLILKICHNQCTKNNYVNFHTKAVVVPGKTVKDIPLSTGFLNKRYYSLEYINDISYHSAD